MNKKKSLLFFSLIRALIIYFIKSPQLKDEAEQKRSVALKALHRSSTYKTQKSTFKIERPFKSTDSSLFCQQCGHPLDLNAEFCSNCGDSTIDERKN